MMIFIMILTIIFAMIFTMTLKGHEESFMSKESFMSFEVDEFTRLALRLGQIDKQRLGRALGLMGELELEPGAERDEDRRIEILRSELNMTMEGRYTYNWEATEYRTPEYYESLRAIHELYDWFPMAVREHDFGS